MPDAREALEVAQDAAPEPEVVWVARGAVEPVGGLGKLRPQRVEAHSAHGVAHAPVEALGHETETLPERRMHCVCASRSLHIAPQHLSANILMNSSSKQISNLASVSANNS